jgi:hypothetical protein
MANRNRIVVPARLRLLLMITFVTGLVLAGCAAVSDPMPEKGEAPATREPPGDGAVEADIPSDPNGEQVTGLATATFALG